MRTLIYLLFGLFLLSGCKEDPIDQPDGPTPYDLKIPSNMPTMHFHPDNPLTVEGIELGRMLYYDPKLHETEERSCASCHIQASSFSSFPSNALAHLNLGFADKFLWKGGIEGMVEDAMLFEVEDFFHADPTRFDQDPVYGPKFRKAFGVNKVTSREMAFALAQFERTMISAFSRFDLYTIGAVQFTESEQRGLALYYSEQGDCFHCHGTTLLTDNQFHNNGLEADPEAGRMEVSGLEEDKGKFKTPTLRNIALTAPYMHDGRFETLEEVVEFYSTGVKHSPTIDPLMKQVDQGGVQLSTQEKSDLVAFLKTFTDTAYVNNPAFSNPF